MNAAVCHHFTVTVHSIAEGRLYLAICASFIPTPTQLEGARYVLVVWGISEGLKRPLHGLVITPQHTDLSITTPREFTKGDSYDLRPNLKTLRRLRPYYNATHMHCNVKRQRSRIGSGNWQITVFMYRCCSILSLVINNKLLRVGV